MIIKGFKVVKTLNGDVVQEVDGTAIPLQMRVYFDNPTAFEGRMRWIIGCVTNQGEVLPCKNDTNEITLDELKYMNFAYIDDEKFNAIKNKTIATMTGEDLLEIIRIVFLENIKEPVLPIEE